MISRKSVIEILLALFITGCVVFFAEKGGETLPSLALNSLAPKNRALLKDDSRHFQAMQNCSQSTLGTTTYQFWNATTNAYQTVTANNSGACGSLAPVLVITTTSQSVITYPFTSPTFQMVLNLDCLTSTATIATSIARLLGVDASQITITSSSCGSLVLQYTCGSLSSSADATNLCSSISTQACNPSTSLGSALKGLTCSQVNSSTSGSSTALYGLFALCAIPILVVFALFLWYRSSQREADNQYMQDTATFSNVATAPQPLGPKPAYPTPAAPAVPFQYTTAP